MKKRLFLASGSASRKKLLTDAKIPFELIAHDADESTVSLAAPLKDVVQNITKLKMDYILMPESLGADEEIYILTADTLTVTHDGAVLGKPKSREHAVEMLQGCRKGNATVGSGFCLEKRICIDGSWTVGKRVLGYNEALCLFDVSDRDVDFYLDNIPFLDVSGGVTIEGFGNQFLKNVQGSYSSIIGLPMFEVREALIEIGFL